MKETPMHEHRTLEAERDKVTTSVSWGGIFAGIVAALGFGVLLLSLGAAVGVTAMDPTEAAAAEGGLIGTGIWTLLSIAVAVFLGAMLASRVSRLLFKQHGTMQGVVVWGGSMLATMLFFGFLTVSATQVGAQLAVAGAEVVDELDLPEEVTAEELEEQVRALQVEAQEAQVEGAMDAMRGFSWWFFGTGLISLGAGMLGGFIGVREPTVRREEPEPAPTREEERTPTYTERTV